MKKSILNIGIALNKAEQQKVNGGGDVFCSKGCGPQGRLCYENGVPFFVPCD